MKFSFLLCIFVLSVCTMSAQQVYVSTGYQAGFLPDGTFKSLPAAYNAANTNLTKKMKNPKLLDGYTVEIGMKVKGGVCIGANFNWSNNTLVSKFPDTDGDELKRKIRYRYNTAGLMLSARLFGAKEEGASVRVAVGADYGTPFVKTCLKGKDNKWKQLDKNDGVLSLRFMPVFRFYNSSNDAYYDIKPFYQLSLADSDLTETVAAYGNSTIGRTQALPMFGLAICVTSFGQKD